MGETLYERMGDERIRRLVDRFYDLMDTLPEAQPIRAMHPEGLEGSREKLYLFLIGWCGGPATYMERFGHPRLRMRHMPFAIDESAAAQWMLCMTQALDELVPEPELHHAFFVQMSRMALHMRNQPQPS